MGGMIRREFPRTIEINASQPISIGRCVVTDFGIVGVAATGKAILYDGLNANGVKKKTLQCVSNGSDEWNSFHGILCETGLYVAVDAVTTFACISYYPVPVVSDPPSES